MSNSVENKCSAMHLKLTSAPREKLSIEYARKISARRLRGRNPGHALRSACADGARLRRPATCDEGGARQAAHFRLAFRPTNKLLRPAALLQSLDLIKAIDALYRGVVAPKELRPPRGLSARSFRNKPAALRRRRTHAREAMSYANRLKHLAVPCMAFDDTACVAGNPLASTHALHHLANSRKYI
jgi:hypothetical protein